MNDDRDNLLPAPARPVKTRRKRRKFSISEKVGMVEATLIGGESASEVARRFDVNANLLFKWRKLYDAGQLQEGAALIPVQVNQQPASEGNLTVEFSGGQRLTVYGEVDGQTLKAVLEVLSQ